MKTFQKYLFRTIKSILLPVIVYLIFFILSGGRFGKPASILAVMRQTVFPVLLAFGVTCNMTMGMWDFSSGAVAIASAIIGCNLAILTGTGVFGIFLFCVLTALILTTFTGFLYTRMNIPALVLTIGLCMLYESIPRVVFGKLKLPQKYSFLNQPPYCFIVLVVVAIVLYIVYNKTVFGANVRAIGANQPVAVDIGIDLKKVKMCSYMFGGALIGVSGAMYAVANIIVTPSTSLSSLGIVFDAIMGVFIAFFLERYCNLVFGVIIGAFTMKLLSAELVAIGLSSNMRDVVTGFFLLALLCLSANQAKISQIRTNRNIRKAALAKQR